MPIPTPRRPTTAGWICLGLARIGPGVAERWLHDDLDLCVLSAVEVAERNPPGTGLMVPHYHVSATRRPKVAGWGQETCTDEEMERVRAAFGMGGAEEDNHGPGKARHLWMDCERTVEPECPCKQDEERTVEGDRVRYETAEDLSFETMRARYIAEIPKRFGGAA